MSEYDQNEDMRKIYYLWGLDCLENFKLELIKNLLPENMGILLDLSDKQILQGIKGYIISLLSAISNLILDSPKIFGISYDGVIQRYRGVKTLKELGYISNSEQARLLRTIAIESRKIRRCKNLKELGLLLEEIKGKINELRLCIENNVFMKKIKEELSIFDINSVKLRILEGLISYLHDENNLSILLHNNDFTFRQDNKFFSGLSLCLGVLWRYSLINDQWDKFLDKIFNKIVSADNLDDYDYFFNEILELFPFLRGNLERNKAYSLKKGKKSVPTKLIDKKIHFELKLGYVFKRYTVTPLTGGNFLSGGSAWQLLFKGMLELGKKYSFKPELLIFYHPSHKTCNLEEINGSLFSEVLGLNPENKQIYTISLAFLLPSYGTFISDASKWLLLLNITSNWAGSSFGEVEMFEDILNDIKLNENEVQLKKYLVSLQELENHILTNSKKSLMDVIKKEEEIHSEIRSTLAELILGWYLLNKDWNIKTGLKIGVEEIDILAVKKIKNTWHIHLGECKEVSVRGGPDYPEFKDLNGFIRRSNTLKPKDILPYLKDVKITEKSKIVLTNTLYYFTITNQKEETNLDFDIYKKVKEYLKIKIQKGINWNVKTPAQTSKMEKEFNYLNKFTNQLQKLVVINKNWERFDLFKEITYDGLD